MRKVASATLFFICIGLLAFDFTPYTGIAAQGKIKERYRRLAYLMNYEQMAVNYGDTVDFQLRGEQIILTPENIDDTVGASAGGRRYRLCKTAWPGSEGDGIAQYARIDAGRNSEALFERTADLHL